MAIELPDSGRLWRWIGGQKPALCQMCKEEPACASTFQMTKGGLARPTGIAIGWECLKRWRASVPEIDKGDDGDDDDGGGVREPHPNPSAPPALETEAEVPNALA